MFQLWPRRAHDEDLLCSEEARGQKQGTVSALAGGDDTLKN